jgi:hypothetical protein
MAIILQRHTTHEHQGLVIGAWSGDLVTTRYFFSAAWAAARSALGTRYGEHDTEFIPANEQKMTLLGSPPGSPQMPTIEFFCTLQPFSFWMTAPGLYPHALTQGVAQFSTGNPGTTVKSLSALTTVVFPRLKAMAAI